MRLEHGEGLATSLHRVQALPTKKGFVGSAQGRHEAVTLDDSRRKLLEIRTTVIRYVKDGGWRE